MVTCSPAKAAALAGLARRAEADWAVSIIVREIATDLSEDAEIKIHSTLLVQIRDARRHTWLANSVFVGHFTSSGAPGRLFIESLDAATGEALAAILAVYPQVVTVSRDGSIVDYLIGQTAPCVAEAGKTFFGLKTVQTNKP